MWSSISHKLRSCSVVQLWWIWGCILLVSLDLKMFQGPLLVKLLLLCIPQIFRECLCCESFFLSSWCWLNWKIQNEHMSQYIIRISSVLHLVYSTAVRLLSYIALSLELSWPTSVKSLLLDCRKPENKFENAPCSSWYLEQCIFKVHLTLSWCPKWSNISLPELKTLKQLHNQASAW